MSVQDSEETCVSSTVFGFTLVLVMLFAFGFGCAGVWWLGTRKSRKMLAKQEQMEKERDALREKEIQVHATATQHYLGEIQRYKSEIEMLRSALDNAGIAIGSNRDSMAPSRPMSYATGNRKSTMDAPKLNFEEKESME